MRQNHIFPRQLCLILFLTALLIVPAIASAGVVNGGFENGNLGSWTVGTGLNGSGFSSPVTGPGSLNLSGGGSNRSSVLNGVTGTQIPPGLTSASTLRYPKYGSYTAVINNQGSSQNVNSLSQTFTAGSSDVDPSDGLIHVRFAYAGVLQNPGHSFNQQPYFYIRLFNVTKNVTLYSAFHYANEAGVNWKSDANSVLYTDWQSADVSPGDAKLAIGDTVQFTAYGGGCALGGHWGELLLDGFGTGRLPGLSIQASADQTEVAPGSVLSYTYNYGNFAGGAVSNISINLPTPANTTFDSFQAPAGVTCTAPAAGAAGTLSCSISSMADSETGNLKMAVRVSGTLAVGSTIVNGNYTIAGTGWPALAGAPVSTPVNALPTTDISLSMTAASSAAIGGNYTYTIIATNNGSTSAPSTVIADTIPTSLTLVSAVSLQGTCTGSRQISCSVGTILPGDTATVTLTVTPGTAGTVSNTASVSGAYSDSDHSNDSATADTIVINPNNPPVANADAASTLDQNPVSINVLSNDTDADNDPLVLTSNGAASNGSVTCSAAGACNYVAAAGFTGTDSFTYVVSDGRGGSATGTATITVSPRPTPTITIAPANFVYDGSAHAAVVTVVGTSNDNLTPVTVTYDGASAAPVAAGSYAVSASFAGNSSYRPVSATATLTISKATPKVTWSAPASIVYGTALGATQLNATADVAGSFAYTPASGTVLNAGAGQTLSATFTPSDAANYNGANASVTIDVAKATPVITWATPAGIVYGTALGSTQLNATADVAGSFNYTPASGTILDAGNATLTSNFTPTDATNYNTAAASVQLAIAKADQTIAWAAPASIVYGTRLGGQQLNATVSVPGPSAAGSLSYIPSSDTLLAAGSGQTLSVTAASTSNYNEAHATVSIDVTRAPLTVTADNSWKTFGDPLPSFTATYQGFVNGETASSLAGTVTFSTSATADSVVGAYAVIPAGVSSSNYAISFGNGTLTVTAKNTTLTTANSSAQYSDSAVLTATVVPATLSAQTATGSVAFTVNGVSVGSAPVGANGVAILVYPLNGAPATASLGASFSSTNVNFNGSVAAAAALTTTAEDAAVTYSGQLFVSTPSTSISSATITLRSTIQDISAVAGSGDNAPGDIRNATVTFVNRDTNQVIASGVPVVLINAGDHTVGLATYNWTATLGSQESSATFTIGTIVGGYYSRNSSSDDALVTLTRPDLNKVTGGGYLVLNASAGSLAGTTGSKSNFGFEAQYNKNLTNLQGHVNLLFQSGGHVYQVKGTPLSLAGVPSTGRVTVRWRVNVQDVTDESNPISIEGNASLEMAMSDLGEPGLDDTISSTLWDKSGTLMFSTNWSGTKAVEQKLGGGNLQVH